MRMIRKIYVILVLLSTAGCGSFHEVHYFATLDRATRQPINYFRLSVNGYAGATNARYIAGYYDERAVDLFLNQTNNGRGATSNNPNGEVRPFFDDSICAGKSAADCAAARNAQLELVPVGGNGTAMQHGAFVLIMSSNADAIAKTIGSFADNGANLDAGLYLLNRGQLNESKRNDAIEPIVTATRDATITEIGTLLTNAAAISDASAAGTDQRTTLYLAAVRAAVRGTGSSADVSDVTKARKWLEAAGSGAQQ